MDSVANPVGIRLTGMDVKFHHRVKGEVYAARDVNITVAPGELLTLLGPSGCGKTTSLRVIAGFQKPSAGTVHIGDRDVTNVLANDRDIGFVFQNYALFPHLNVFENVAYGLRVRSQPQAVLEASVGDILRMVGLAGYERQMPHQLSGGEQQRVALARAIVVKPRVLLFDEPLSNLDAKLRISMRGEIQSLQKRLGITTVYVTHDQEEAMAISDRIVVMNQGRVVQVGTAGELYRSPASIFVAGFIGRTNLLPAVIRGAAGGRLTLDIVGTAHTLDGAQTDLGSGSKVQCVMRPETIGLTPESAPGTVPGIVRSRTYLGEKTEYTVEVSRQQLFVVQFGADAERFAPGAAIGVALPVSGVQVLSGDQS